ncbi:MAG: hypothetical protein RIS79_3921 [Verrucomicrobiota bacterium]
MKVVKKLGTGHMTMFLAFRLRACVDHPGIGVCGKEAIGIGGRKLLDARRQCHRWRLEFGRGFRSGFAPENEKR